VVIAVSGWRRETPIGKPIVLDEAKGV